MNAAVEPPVNKVFGIGLSRTGTLSLTIALRSLGLRAVHYPSDGDTQADFKAHFAAPRPELHLQVLEQCEALTDTPVCSVFEQLDLAYPGSRFILTVRDKASWLASCAKWWENVVLPMATTSPDRDFAAFMNMINVAVYGTTVFDEAAFSRTFDEYHERVHGHFRDRERDLLVLDLCGGDGWSDLANFLGRDVPPGPFPFANRWTDDKTTGHAR